MAGKHPLCTFDTFVKNRFCNQTPHCIIQMLINDGYLQVGLSEATQPIFTFYERIKLGFPKRFFPAK